ncbi:hypothetical protein ACO2RV_24290 [Ancylobacter sp. VNQ12]|uniref:hypothetical protein n=1 Tax=Ancylobacter sp. VNQ12 TaxID=3400920 RepID=UPI003C07DD5D
MFKLRTSRSPYREPPRPPKLSAQQEMQLDQALRALDAELCQEAGRNLAKPQIDRVVKRTAKRLHSNR